MEEYKRFLGESDDELIYRIGKDHDRIGTWQQVADILNKLLGYDYGESTYRKKYTTFQRMFEANQRLFTNSDEQLRELEDQRRALEREKIKFRDERRAWQKQNYIDARAEDKLDKLEEALLSISPRNFPTFEPVQINSDNTILIMLQDLHIGATFSNYWGEYNSDIAEHRLALLLSEVLRIQKRHGTSDCVVVLGGDILSGNIHKSIQVTNRENVIDQIKIAIELISQFCYELSKNFNKVSMVSVSGNHSRIDKKDEAIHGERMDDIVAYGIGLALNHISNFEIMSDLNLDTSIAVVPIRGKNYITVHGDYDGFSKQGAQNLMSMVGMIPYAILYGHMHTSALDECNGVKMVRGGSLAGSGDDFTIERRLSGKPSQMVCVCTERGIEAYYPVCLED